MSKKSTLDRDMAVTSSQVDFHKFSTDVIKQLLALGSSSCSVLLQVEEGEEKSPKQSPHRRRKSSKQAFPAHKKKNWKRSHEGDTTLSYSVLSSSVSNLSKSSASNLSKSSTSNLFKNSRGLSVTGSSLRLRPRSPSARATSLCKPLRVDRLDRVDRVDEALNSKKPCLLAALRPTNMEQEKARFFESDFSYEPQFEYSSGLAQAALARHSTASDRFLTQAVHIMEVALERYGSYEHFEQVTGGALLSKSRIWSSVKKYMEKEGCVGEVVVRVTDDIVSRASLTVVNSRATLSINAASAREHWLEGTLRHEIGTHYFRGLNNVQQPWSSSAGRRRFNLLPLNPTEEGLASIHSVLFRQDPTLWRAALLYLTVHQASSISFSRLFQYLGRFVQDPHTRWEYCVRAKRGQTDTAQPGCFSKDQVYLEGVLKILRNRNEINFPLLMSLGKVAFEDIERLRPFAQVDNIRIPHFMQDQAKYQEQLTKIMAVNKLTDKELNSII